MPNTLKRKRDREHAEQDPQLQEYLSLMQQSKSRTWANDDRMAKPVVEPLPQNGHVEEEKKEEEEEEEEKEDPSYAHRKEAKADDPRKSAEATEDIRPDGVTEDEGQETKGPGESDTSSPAAPISDVDWLRSKTSRLLGLLDDDEQAEYDASHRKVDHEQAADSNRDSRTAGHQSTEPGADKGTGEAVVEKLDVDVDVDNIRASARLFVRNLSYDTTETDLEPVFAPFGKIEEVSLVSLIPSVLLFTQATPTEWCASVMIFLIGTSDAKHLM